MATQQAFWKPKPIQPTAPEQGWIAKLLRWSIWISCAGWIVYSLFAFAFDDINIIPAAVQSALVLFGSGFIVAGAELNTGPMCVAVFGKIGSGNASKLDKRALVVSAIGSMVSILITFSIRQTRFADSWWRHFALSWGPLIAGITVAADYYAASAELGLLKSDYDKAMETWLERMEQWLAEAVAWNEAHGIQEPVDRSQWRTATVNDFRVLVTSLNGDRATLTPDNLQHFFDAMQLRLDASDSTVRRWLKMEAE